MRAAIVGEEGLSVAEAAMPQPKPNEIRVRVHAASLNRADLAVAAGRAHGAMGGPGTIPGLEWAGEIDEVGAEAEGFAVGDRVMCTGSGGYAQYAATDFGRVSKIPDGMSYETAATLPLALQTMHDALVTNGRLRAGESVMIQGASSGVGLMALQIARLRGASVVIGTSTNAERRARLREFGATHVLDTTDPQWPEQARAATGGKGVDVIVDQISASVANGNLEAAAVLGRIVNVGRLGGGKGEFDFDLHALKRVTYVGVTFRTRSVEEIRTLNAKMRSDLWSAVEGGTLGLPIDRTYPLEEVGEALARMRENRHFGKILLLPHAG